MNKPGIVFMGTPGFAVPSLRALIDAGYPVNAVVTSPDKPSGRGRSVQFSQVKEFALQNGLRILQPENLKHNQFLNELKEVAADIFVVVAFRMLPEEVWSIPPLGTFNLHASLLPQYRGAAPINHVIINGEKITGVTTFFIDHKMDTGKVIYQKAVDIEENENAGTLHDKLMLDGAEAVVETVRMIEEGNFQEIPQEMLIKPGEVLKPAPKIFKEYCRINWHTEGEKIVNFIRGLSPYPAAFAMLENPDRDDILVKIFDAAFFKTEPEGSIGTIVTDQKEILKVTVPDGYISIQSLQVQGKNRMDAKSFLAGFRNINSFKFS